jgi:anti-sigma factor RsiW
MTDDHERYADWDAAYVLGALAPADRRDYEAHLETCERCRRAVADLAPMPGLLGRIDDAAGLAMLEPAVADEGPRPDLVERVRAADRVRRRRRRVRVGVVLAAAAAIVAAVAIPIGVLRPAPAPTQTLALSGAADVPLTASVTVTERGWGTQLDVDCAYRAGAGDGTWSYELAVTADDGTSSTVSSWTARSGKEVRLTGATSVPYDRIRTIEIRTLPEGRSVLHSDFAG